MLQLVEFNNCSLAVLPVDFEWPAALQTVLPDQTKLMEVTSTFIRNSLQTIPKGLPSTLKKMSAAEPTYGVQANAISDLNYLPPNVEFINFQRNRIKQLVGNDFSKITFMYARPQRHACAMPQLRRFLQNPLTTLAHITFSPELSFLSVLFGGTSSLLPPFSDIDHCPITNITLSMTAFKILDALPRWKRDNDDLVGFSASQAISTDPVACAAIGGQIHTLWAGVSNNSVTACILSALEGNSTTAPVTTLPPPVATSDSSSTCFLDTGLIIGLSIAGVIVLAAILVCLYRKRRSFTDAGVYRENQSPRPSALFARDCGTGGKNSEQYADVDDTAKLEIDRL
ncbi:hypothetical protein ACHHYP_20160 [Achlya hypogyna]|uniref:Uncharacterized protein n=1 Tax=Achlya hypogyna TaxID=1202772 RepID=A0A1V9ZPE6_ACHHY|nr:hypothetical protein ACHHYP_20160 [Achlya hypogyna]